MANIDLAFYKDKAFRKPFSIENLGDVDAGDLKIVEGYLYNATPFEIVNIKWEVPDKDVHLENVPKKLPPESWALVEVHYAPNEMRITPLDTFVTFRGKKRIPPE